MSDTLPPGVEEVVAEIFEAFARAKVTCYAREDVGLSEGVVLNVEVSGEVVCVSIQPEEDPVDPKVRESWESADHRGDGA